VEADAARLIVRLLLAAFLASAPAFAQQGMQLRQAGSLAPGRVAALVELDGPTATLVGNAPKAADFAIQLPTGAARDLKVSRNGERGSTSTIIAVDVSGSYKNGVGRTIALPAIKEYVRKLSKDDEAGLVLFGTTPHFKGIHRSAGDFVNALDDAWKAKAEPNTNLVAGIRAAVEQVKAQPWLGEVVIFTDGGDEAKNGDQAWRELTEMALKKGVRVNVVTVDKKPSDIEKGDWLAAQNHLKALADATSGLYDTTGNSVETKLADAREKARNWLFLDGGLCGVAAGGGPIQVYITYIPSTAKSNVQSFTPQTDARSAEACAAAAVAKQCTANENCAGGICKDGVCEPIPTRPIPWLWIALGGGALLLLIIGAVALLRKKEPPPVEEVAPAPLAVEPPKPELPPAPAAAESPLVQLPETHLQAVGGEAVGREIVKGQRWRLHKQKMLVGGDAAAGNDIVFAVGKVSGQHARFELYQSGALWVTDEGSTNGTFVNGRRLAKGERVELKPGDTVELSKQLMLQVVRPGFDAPEPPASSPEGGAVDGAEQAPGKKATVFDPGNRR